MKKIPEKVKIEKDASVLINNLYENPKTNLLIFRFGPDRFTSIEQRLKSSSIQYHPIEEKDLYIMDRFFSNAEGDELRKFSQTTEFSKEIFASPESKENGEKPARAMNGKEKWEFFSNPPSCVSEMYKLLGFLAQQLNADISTLPWELWELTTSSPSVATNFLEEVSQESMDLGRHRDYHPEKGISFGIPILYSEKKQTHPAHFVNGEEGKPWLISLMLYATAENFRPEYGMGTAFYNHDESLALSAACTHMRIILFEGDIIHSIETSNVPDDVKTWRVSYVFKLIVNPKEPNTSVKKKFRQLLKL